MMHLCDFALTLACGMTMNSDNTWVYVPKLGDTDIAEGITLYKQEGQNNPIVTLVASLGDGGKLGSAILSSESVIDCLKEDRANYAESKDTDAKELMLMQEVINSNDIDIRDWKQKVHAMKE